MAREIIRSGEKYKHSFTVPVTTTDATVTTLLSIPIPANACVHLRYTFEGIQTDFTNAIGGEVFNIFRRASGGNIERVGTEKSTINKDTSFMTCDCYVEIDNSGYNLLIRAKGKLATNIKWTIETDYLELN